jgi:amino acid adenylation domain-containing protein
MNKSSDLRHQTSVFNKNSNLTTEMKDYQNKCIHQVFAEQVKKTPDAVAVVFENQQLSYRELNAKANQLAHHLQAMGVGSEVLVGLCVERSIEVIIGIFGILKAGGAYVPLDPTYPQERLAFMLEDTNLKVVLTKTEWIEILPVITASVILLDADWQKIEQQSQQNPVCDVTPENLAYLIYTSGSTGKPKGVQMPHASVGYYLQAIAKILPVNSNDIYLHTASFSFTASVRQLFLPLSQGATSVIATREQTRTPLSLFELIQNQGVTISDGVPSVWRYGLMALESLEEKYTKALSESKLRLIIFGGELLPYQLIKKLRNLFQAPPRFFNILGQTESIGNGFYSIPEDCNIEEGYVPVGHPLKDIQQVYVLNSQLEPVKIGESGELHIAGSTLARGYLNRTQANVEKFIDNPFNTEQILFKTGDVARYSSDGTLEILGRIDFQVNIRGMRVELEEIESVLKFHPSVREGIVTAREDIPGDQRLVAYIVANNQAFDWGEIRSFLEQKLPDYMVPNAFVLMEKLPVLPNGKLDRHSLPAPNIFADIRNFVAPRTPTEQVIASIWTEVLRLEKVGIYDNFLELGGHSLLASLVISRLRETLSVELSVGALFESPTVASLSEQIETSHQQKQQTNLLPALQPVSRSLELPLSLTQQRFWFLDQMEGANAAYNIARALRLVGRLNLTALQQAVEEIIQRHETLRTSFGMVDDKPVQFIAATVPFTLPLVDLQELPEVERLVQLQRLITAEYTRPFDLTIAPLFRVSLIRLESESHVLLLTMHHIISDAWSVEIFLQELSVLYAASPLPELPIQYADYSYWQRQWLQNDVITTQLNYWKQQLADAPPIMELPTNRPRSAMQTFRGSIQRFKLGNELTNKLKTLSQKSGASLFMTLQAAFVTLLSRYTSQEDIVIGSPITNRNRLALESLIGFFVNTLVLRTQLKNNPTFRELLAQVRQVALDAYTHQDVPFDQLVEVLQPQRHLSHSPLFQVMFVLQNSPVEKLELPGLSVTQIELDRPTAGATFDLTLSMQEIDSELRGAFEYNANLFDADTIARMAGHFQTLVEGIVTNPDECVGQLPLLTAAEQHQLLIEWNNTQTDYPHQCIHELFEQQVERTPDAVAVGFGNQQLTYRELNTRANKIAHYLQKLGVGEETLVGICLERTPTIIVAMLGILKAGGAYLPLDPTHPSDRLAFMLQDSQAFLLLTEQQLCGQLTTVEQICLDSDWSVICQESQDNLKCDTTADNLAYVIYTSGSTGTPKGVMVTHTGLSNLAQAQIQTFGVQNLSRILQFASLSFDASIWEVVMALGSGATLYLGTKDSLLPGMPLIQLLRDYCITHITLPPSALAALPVEQLPALETMIVAGEQASPELIKLWSVDRNFFNAYGPTEASVCATIAKCTPEDEKITIGRPIANTQIYILDQYLQPVPIGVPGELHIGGVGLARGYLNRPELTAQKFIPHPFQVNYKLYKTGDLARYLPDGNVEFLGRIDNQVKIRGFRIESGEIETLLSQHPQVQQAVVTVREDHPGNKYLTAYVVGKTETLTSSELRQFLKPQLPEYMMPTAFVFLNVFPLTPNGKIDRRALKAPNLEESRETAFIPPRNRTEEIIASIMATVLGLEQVGIHDNFFELGGHSLLATQVISRLRETFAVEISLRCLFASPTIASLCEVIETIAKEGLKDESFSSIAFDTLPPLVPADQEIQLPLSITQQFIWHYQQTNPNSYAYNSRVVLRVTPAVSSKVLEKSINEIIRRHSILRTSFIIKDGQPVQVISKFLTIPLVILDLQHLPPEERELAARKLALKEAKHRFDLGSCPLLRTTLLQLAQEEYWLLITMHHIITDGWSYGIFLEELKMLYHAFLNGLHSPLPEVSLQYADFALWEQKCWQEGLFQKQLSYWQNKLANISTSPSLLPTDFPQLTTKSPRASYHSVVLPETLVTSIQTLARSQGVSIFTIILTALKIFLFKWSGQSDILVLATVANRNTPTIEKILGCFINDVLLLTQIDEHQTGITLLQQVNQTVSEANNNQQLPLVECKKILKGRPTVSITMVPSIIRHTIPCPCEFLNYEILSVPCENELWNQDDILDFYVSSYSANSKLIQIAGYCSTDSFKTETIDDLFRYFQEIIKKLVDYPETELFNF